jgi:GxxExxY protein
MKKPDLFWLAQIHKKFEPQRRTEDTEEKIEIIKVELNEISGKIIECALRVHTALGAGLLESAYEACLLHELRKCGSKVEAQIMLPIVYDGSKVDAGYRIDSLVENLIIVGLKAAEKLLPIHEAQLFSYLKLSGKKLGLLINFNTRRLRDGIKRIVI